MISHSNSATAAMIVKVNLPWGVEVSMPSETETKSMLRALNSSSAVIRCFTDRAKRSKRQQATTETRPRFTSAMLRASELTTVPQTPVNRSTQAAEISSLDQAA